MTKALTKRLVEKVAKSVGVGNKAVIKAKGRGNSEEDGEYVIISYTKFFKKTELVLFKLQILISMIVRNIDSFILSETLIHKC